MQRRLGLGWALFYILGAGEVRSEMPEAAWKAGTARAVITPRQPLWLAGYGGRDHPSEGTLHDVWIKALALEDAAGHRAVILTSDLCGLGQEMYDSLCRKFQEQFGLDRSQVMLTFSHNHCAPVTRGDLVDYYPLDQEQQARVNEYSDWLEEQMVTTIGEALDRLAPATLEKGEGVCTFAVNRRNNIEAEVAEMLARGETPKGPVDHSVPVLAVHTGEGDLWALLFGYACHNTTLSFYQWCGDYAGFAQIALEKSHPGTTAMFFMGCGGDQNPLPRRTVELCEKYGNQLAAATEEVLQRPMTPVAPQLRTVFDFVHLDFERNPTREELEEAAREADSVRGRWARRTLALLNQGVTFPHSYPYPVQVWRLGRELLWISLGAEAVVDYALRFKKQFGPNTWVGGYAHTQVAYIPSRRVWEEGGYEGGSLYEYGHPAYRWAGDVEDRIAATVERLVKAVDEGLQPSCR